MKRTILFTTPTSATGSLWRIVQAFAPKEQPRISAIDDCLGRGMSFDEIKNYQLPEVGCFLFNQPHLFNFNQDFSDTQFVVNFRDPRDMSCNQYYWVFSHPNNRLSEEELKAYRDRVREAGIDRYVLDANNNGLFQGHIAFSKRPELLDRSLITSFAQLCFDTSGVIERLAACFQFEDRELIDRMKAGEHPSSMTSSSGKWVSVKWEGADVFPGRARVELKPSTFAELTSRYSDVLRVLKDLDQQKYSLFYSE